MDVKNKSAAPSLESNGSHVAEKTPPSVISNQLRDELIRILRTGDAKKDGAFTIAIALQVEKFTAAAREILMTENLAQKDLGSLMMMRKHQLGGPYIGLGSYVGGNVGNDGLGSLGSSDGYLPLPPITNNENFGVQAIRQIVDSIRTMGESPAKLVEALAVARLNNLTDIVTVLEKKLGVVSKAEVAPQGEAPNGEAA